MRAGLSVAAEHRAVSHQRVITNSEDSIVTLNSEYIYCKIYLCSIYCHLHCHNHNDCKSQRTERPAVAPGTHILVQPLSCDERPLPYLPFKMLMISAADAPPSLRMLNMMIQPLASICGGKKEKKNEQFLDLFRDVSYRGPSNSGRPFIW